MQEHKEELECDSANKEQRKKHWGYVEAHWYPWDRRSKLKIHEDSEGLHMRWARLEKEVSTVFPCKC